MKRNADNGMDKTLQDEWSKSIPKTTLFERVQISMNLNLHGDFITSSDWMICNPK